MLIIPQPLLSSLARTDILNLCLINNSDIESFFHHGAVICVSGTFTSQSGLPRMSVGRHSWVDYSHSGVRYTNVCLLDGICLGFQGLLKVLASNHMVLIATHPNLADSVPFISCKGRRSQLQQALWVFNFAGFGPRHQVRDVGDVPNQQLSVPSLWMCAEKGFHSDLSPWYKVFLRCTLDFVV